MAWPGYTLTAEQTAALQKKLLQQRGNTIQQNTNNSNNTFVANSPSPFKTPGVTIPYTNLPKVGGVGSNSMFRANRMSEHIVRPGSWSPNQNSLNTERVGGKEFSVNPNPIQTNSGSSPDYASTAKSSGYTPGKQYDYAGTAKSFGYTPGQTVSGKSPWSWSDMPRAMDPNSIQGPLQPGQSTLGTTTTPPKPGINKGVTFGTILAGMGAVWGGLDAINKNKQDQRFNRALDRQINENKRLMVETRFADENAAVDTGNLAGQTIDELRMSKDPNERAALSGSMSNAYNNMNNAFRFNADQRGQLASQNANFMSMKRPTTSPLLAGLQGGFQGLGGALSMGTSMMSAWDKIKNPNKYFDILGKDSTGKGTHVWDPESKQYIPA